MSKIPSLEVTMDNVALALILNLNQSVCLEEEVLSNH